MLDELTPQTEIMNVFQMILEDHFKAQDEKHFKQIAKLEKDLTELEKKKDRMIENLTGNWMTTSSKGQSKRLTLSHRTKRHYSAKCAERKLVWLNSWISE